MIFNNITHLSNFLKEQPPKSEGERGCHSLFLNRIKEGWQLSERDPGIDVCRTICEEIDFKKDKEALGVISNKFKQIYPNLLDRVKEEITKEQKYLEEAVEEIQRTKNVPGVFERYKPLIKNQELLVELAIATAKENGHKLCKNIAMLDIKKEEARYRIAQAAVNTCGYLAIENIDNFQLKEKEYLKEIIKSAMEKEPYEVWEPLCEIITQFSEEERLELIDYGLKFPNGEIGVASYLMDLKITDEEKRVAVIKKVAQMNGGVLINVFADYEIEKREVRFEIAKLVVENVGYPALSCLDDVFDLSDNKDIEECAWIALKKELSDEEFNSCRIERSAIANYKYVSMRFDLIEFLTRKRVARKFCERKGERESNYEQMSTMERNKVIPLMLLSGITEDEKVVSLFIDKSSTNQSKDINDLNLFLYHLSCDDSLDKESKLNLIQKIIAEPLEHLEVDDKKKKLPNVLEGLRAAREILVLGCADERLNKSKITSIDSVLDQLEEEITKEQGYLEEAVNEVKGTYEFDKVFEKYQPLIKNQELLVELAIAAEKENGYELCKNIQILDIKKEEARYRIAQAAVKTCGYLAIEKIDNFQLKEKEYLKEIIKSAMEKEPYEVWEPLCEIITQFSEEERLELIDHGLKFPRGAKAIAGNLMKLGITDEKKRIEIIKKVAQIDGKAVTSKFEEYGIKKRDVCVDIAKIAIENVGYSALDDLGAHDLFENKDIEECAWVALKKELSDEEFNSCIIERSAIADYKYDSMRVDLIKFLISEKVARKFCERKGKRELNYDQISTMERNKVIPLMLLSGITEDEKVVSLFIDKSTTKQSKDINDLNLFLYYLSCEDSLDKESKLNLIQKIITEPLEHPEGGDKKKELPNVLKGLRAAREIMIFRCADERLNKSKITSIESVLDQMGGLFKDYLKIDLEDFDSKYEDTLGTFRSKPFITYIKGLEELEDSNKSVRACALFKEYLTSVLEGKFKSLRYDEAKNLHLKTVLEGTGDLKGKWMAGDTWKGDRDCRYDTIDSDDPCDLLLAADETSGCLSTSGFSIYNVGLLGCMLNGHTRLIAAKNERGETIARCWIRLLSDGKRPVLYQEPIYSKGVCPRGVETRLNEMCLRRAKALNLPLYAKKKGGGEEITRTLKSLKGLAEFEYSDGQVDDTHKAKVTETIEIKKSCVVWEPGVKLRD